MKNCIRELRKRKRITQEDLANATNVTRQTINAVEQGKYAPSLELAFSISDFFRKKIDDVFDYRKT